MMARATLAFMRLVFRISKDESGSSPVMRRAYRMEPACKGKGKGKGKGKDGRWKGQVGSR